jgi:hypothetical protein
MTADRRTTTDYRLQLLQEMRCQNYDMIRFASYRTACKLRYVQKKVYCEYYLNLIIIYIIVIVSIKIAYKHFYLNLFYLVLYIFR